MKEFAFKCYLTEESRKNETKPLEILKTTKEFVTMENNYGYTIPLEDEFEIYLKNNGEENAARIAFCFSIPLSENQYAKLESRFEDENTDYLQDLEKKFGFTVDYIYPGENGDEYEFINPMSQAEMLKILNGLKEEFNNL